MFKKFGMRRQEIFVNSKQGILCDNSYEQAQVQLILEELKKQTSLEEDDLIPVMRNDEEKRVTHYMSLQPAFLDFSLNYTRRSLQLETLDAALLMTPFEFTYRHKLETATDEKRRMRYRDAMANAFEFYEQAVQDGRIRSYGITATESLLQDPKFFNDCYKIGIYMNE